MAAAPGLDPGAERRAGSSPALGTNITNTYVYQCELRQLRAQTATQRFRLSDR